MNKIVGARISDSLYDKMKEDGRSQTSIIREALTQYYSKNERKIYVNRPLTTVNNKKNEDRYQRTKNEVDNLLDSI